MAYIGKHENVISLIGACTEGIRIRSIYIATELCELGSLNSFLRKSKSTFMNTMNDNQLIDPQWKRRNLPLNFGLTILDLISFSAQIAKGMEYIADKNVVHADLATRNVLLTVTKVARISDFGLSKRLYDNNYYRKGSKCLLPWRWMAVECLKSLKFSTSTDIWAYGVTLYEIFSLGDTPFPNETWSDNFVSKLENGMRMKRPKYCTEEIYMNVRKCWENDPDLRSKFPSLRSYFEELYEKLCKEISENESGKLDDCHYVEVVCDL